MVLLSLFSLERFGMYSNYSEQVTHSGKVIINIRTAEVMLRDIGLTERGYMITHDSEYLQRFRNSIDSINSVVGTLKELIADNPEQQRNLSLLKGAIALRIAAAKDNIAYADSTHSSAGSKYYEDSRSMMRDCAQKLTDMRTTENRLLEERYKSAHFYQKLTNDTLKYLLFVFCVITLVLFAFMIKELRSRLIYQEELQNKIVALRRSHSELREIAYAASHDLQEPMRKMRMFSDIAANKPATEEERREALSRIGNSAHRMQMLISDLMTLTSLADVDEEKSPVDLNEALNNVLAEMADRIKQKEGFVERQRLPIIDAYENQVKTLFRSLIDNSLKFTREGVKPIITVSVDTINGFELSDINPDLLNKKFYRITFSDNGMGFENKFITKMFQIFQRLHNQESEYDGKGIGLAICQRIMVNHAGYIIARGEPGMGAKFKLFFPYEG